MSSLRGLFRSYDIGERAFLGRECLVQQGSGYTLLVIRVLDMRLRAATPVQYASANRVTTPPVAPSLAAESETHLPLFLAHSHTRFYMFA